MLKKIIIAPDSFKGTMSSKEICDIIAAGIRNIRPEMHVVKIPIADGGEGTVDAFLAAVGGERISVRVKDPLFRDIDTFYGILQDGKTAVIEMAAASGLPLVEDCKNPLITTTYGTGQLIRNALDHGCTRVILGIGGSATNDGGIGAAAALGVRFLDCGGNEVPLNGEGLARLEHIDESGLDPRISECEVLVACDVSNPLYGPEGAACVYAPQKGADEAMVKLLDENLKHYAGIIEKQLGLRVQDIPGTGAAGGMGVALIAFTGAVLKPGIKIILDIARFDEVLQDADLVITGEGKIDGQSLRGKVPVGIAERASKYKVPVIAIVGDIGDDIEGVYQAGITSVFSTNRKAIPFENARVRCKQDLLQTVEAVMRFTSVMEGKD